MYAYRSELTLYRRHICDTPCLCNKQKSEVSMDNHCRRNQPIGDERMCMQLLICVNKNYFPFLICLADNEMSEAGWDSQIWSGVVWPGTR